MAQSLLMRDRIVYRRNGPTSPGRGDCRFCRLQRRQEVDMESSSPVPSPTCDLRIPISGVGTMDEKDLQDGSAGTPPVEHSDPAEAKRLEARRRFMKSGAA